jgi:uncharacterized protein (TIGR00299 family) protein
MIAFLDLPSGLSGDMLLGCLLDSGWEAQRLRNTIELLPLDASEWAVEVRQVVKSSLRATRVEVLAEEATQQRRLRDVAEIINRSTLPEIVRKRAVAIFQRLANAEARVHGTTPDQIHFHEVGAVDAIIDIVASVNGLHELGIERLYASAIPLGHGWTNTAHGRIPLPAPATIELLASVNAPTRPAPGPGELLTPTGAAILAELATFEQPAISVSRIGIGAGQRDFDWPNVARMWLGEASATQAATRHEPTGSSAIVRLETNIDDMNPQIYSVVADKLLKTGALDVWLTPVQMKKGRPGVVISVLATVSDEAKLADILLRETSTLGVRILPIIYRHEARRELREVCTPLGKLRVKVKWIGDEAVDAVPEFEDCRIVAESNQMPVLRVQKCALVAGQALIDELRAAANGAAGMGKSST